MSSFRFQARYALITYAQCGSLDPFEVSNHFSSLGAECIIGRETHADGGHHLHAFIDFGKKFNSRNTRIFDVGGCHPNIEQSRGQPWTGYDYAIKDGNVVAGGLERPIDTGRERLPSTLDKWTTITSAETVDEFWKLLQELDPCAMVRSFTQCRAYADHKYRVCREPYVTPAGLNIDTSRMGELDEWVTANLQGHTPGGKSYSSAYSFQGGIPTGGEPLPPFQSRFGALVRILTNLYVISARTVINTVRTNQNGQDRLGKITRRSCILWWSVFYGRRHRHCEICHIR